MRLSGVPQQGWERLCLGVAALGKTSQGLSCGGGLYRPQAGATGGLAVVVGVVARESSGERRRRGSEVWVWVHSKNP